MPFSVASSDIMDDARAWLRGFCVLLWNYYTVWTNAVFLLYQTGYLHPCLGTSVKLMLMTTSVGGAYVTYVSPRVLVVKGVFPVDIVMQGWALQAGDFFSHHLPLLVFLSQDHQRGPRLPYLLVVSFYLLGHDPRVQYNLETKDVALVFSVVTVFFFLL